ncbi:MAG: nucleoside triphosphate pyrophosphohydrolase [Candidatus Acidiferrales bacterium]
MKIKRKTERKSAWSRPAKKVAVRSGILDPKIPITKRDREAGDWFARLVALQSKLRGPGGCPWDREQTHTSLRRFLIEEAYEVLDAIEAGEAEHFASELGDLLLQVVFHSILAEETGAFAMADVLEAVHTKMVRRHPHVFGDLTANDSKAVLRNWEQIKAEERAGKGGARDKKTESVLSGVSRSLPALMEADHLTRKAARIRFDWEQARDITEKIREELREVDELLPVRASQARPQQESAEGQRIEEEVGDLLFAAVNLARFLEIDPEVSLKKANAKFKRRFEWMEGAAVKEGSTLAAVPRDRMEELWSLAKKETPAAARASRDSKRKLV